MLGAIQMPEWAVDFWTVWGDMITPALVTLLCSILGFIAVRIKASANKSNENVELQIKLLESLVNKENLKPFIDACSNNISLLEQQISVLGEMISISFKEANIPPEIKEKIEELLTRLKYGGNEDLVKELEKKNEMLSAQVNDLNAQLEAKNAPVVVETTAQEPTAEVKRR